MNPQEKNGGIWMKQLIRTVIAGVMLSVTVQSVVVQAETDITVRYTALGDSLAVGVNEQGELGTSYTDYFAQRIEATNLPVWFNKGFATPGYTTANVLADLQANVSKPVYNTTGKQSNELSIYDGIAGANVLTISAGANDVLKHVIVDAAGQVTIDEQRLLEEVEQVAENYDAIMKEIKTLNRHADVLVMGYYNPFPQGDDDLKTELTSLVSMMDEAVRQVVEQHDGVFVEVADLIAKDVQAYLPNRQNIHLSAAGYKAVAEKMYESYVDHMQDESAEQALNYFRDTQTHWARDYIQFVAGARIMNGYEDATFQPNAQMTRVQLVSVLSRAFDWHALEAVPFLDVASYAEVTQSEVTAAYEAGVVKGYNGYLKPKELVTRAQLASMLLRAYEHEIEEVYEPNVTAPFTDITNYDAETQRAITFLYEFELAQGVSQTEFAPANPLTRAQAAKILANVYSE